MTSHVVFREFTANNHILVILRDTNMILKPPTPEEFSTHNFLVFWCYPRRRTIESDAQSWYLTILFAASSKTNKYG